MVESGSSVLSNSSQGLLCPNCQVSLVMTERQGIEIDYCPQCRGVWLDRGELDKIIERSAIFEGGSSQTPSADQPPASVVQQAPSAWQGRAGTQRTDGYDAEYDEGHGGHRRGHGGGHGRRRGSFLERLFD